MSLFEIEQYMKKNKSFTIPEIQQKFQLKYIDARSFFKQLEENHQIFMKKGIQFGYNFAIEKTLDQYRKILWNCILENEYHKYDVRRKYNMTSSESNEFEKWLNINNYYDFETDIILISKEEFINRYGKIKDNKPKKDKESVKKSYDDLFSINADDDDDEFNFDKLQKLINLNADEDEDDDDEDEDDDIIEKGDLLEIDNFQMQYERIFKIYLEKDPSMTKKQFISFIESQFGEEHILFPARQILVNIIKNVKDLSEEEFQKLRASILAKK